MAKNLNELDVDSFLKDAEEAGRLDEAKAFLENRFGKPAPQSDRTVDQTFTIQQPGPYEWAVPGAAVGAAAAAGYGLKSIKDRLMNKPEPTVRVEPQMDVNQQRIYGGVEPSFEPEKTTPPPKFVGTEEQKQQILKSEDVTAQKQMEAAKKATAPVVPTVPQVAAQTAPVVPPTVAEMGQQAAPVITEAAQTPAKSLPPAEKNKGGRPPKGEAKQWTYGSKAELPEGTVFKEGWGGADNWLNDQVGKERAREIRNMYNQGRGFGSGKEAMTAAAQAMQDAGQQRFMTQGEPFTLSSENRERFGIAPPKQQGRLSKTFEKGVKVGGVAGLLLTAAEAANAKQAAQNVGEALLPIGMMPSTAGAPVLPPSVLAAQQRQLQEMQKLGSPYRTR